MLNNNLYFIKKLSKIHARLVLFSLVIFWAQTSVSASVCWKDSYGRGVGIVPGSCPAGQVKDGLLCYPAPEPGYKNPVVGVYSQNCPPNYRDDGLFCAKPGAYNRGAGYPWKFGDKAFSLDGPRQRCTTDNPQGCDQDGAIIYPKCKPGFSAVGCCTCSPNCPAGMTDMGVSCTKKTYVRGPITPQCAKGEQYEAGLCYKKCGDIYKGIGPVCWGSCPKDKPIDCGAMCGSSIKDCTESIVEQVVAVGSSVAKIASLVGTAGVASGVTAATEAAKSAAIESLKETAKKLAKDLAKKFGGLVGKKLAVQLAPELKKAGIPDILVDKLVAMATEPDTFDYLSFMAGIDPTGISKAVQAFNLPICGKNLPKDDNEF